MTLPTTAAGNTSPEPLQPTTTAVPVVVEPGTGAQPDWKAIADEWKSRAIGYQKSMQNEQAARQNVEALAAAANQQITGLTTERDNAVKGLSTIKEDVDTKTTELDIANAELERMTMIATEFPQLLPLIKEDALPDGTGDELRKKLTALASHVGVVQTQNNAAHSQGATPPAPSSAIRDAKTVYAQALEAAKQNKTVEYNTLIDEYHKLLAGQTQK